MRPTNFLVRSLTGSANRLEMVSPYLFGQRKLLNRYFLAGLRDLPITGMTLRAKTFDFGFNNPALTLAPFAAQDTNLVIKANFLVWGIVGTSSFAASGDAGPSPAYLFNILHSHEGKQITWFNKDVSDTECAGSAKRPYLLRRPQLVIAGDSLQVEIQNLTGSNLNAQIVLYGGEFS